MKNTNSLWTKSTSFPQYPVFSGEKAAEVVVIGGGMAGILTAYFLHQKGIAVIVLEANRVASGQTGNTTAKITSQHNLIYDRLIQSMGEEKARQYAAANQQAISQYRQIIEEKAIQCDFRQLPAYLYTSEKASPDKNYTTTPDYVTLLEREANAAKSLGIDAVFTEDTHLPFQTFGAIKFNNQAQFHPLKFLETIIKDLTIYENTRIETVEGNRIGTNVGSLTAEKIIFATHYPFINFPGYYFLRMHQERSYVLALEHAMELDGMYLGVDENSLSFRNQGDFLLLGGGSHRTGENSAGGKYEMLRGVAKSLFPQSKETYCWSAQDCMSMDGIPYIGPFSESTPNWYVATGFNKWGMTSSMVSAMILSDLITEKDNPNADVFSPRRFVLSTSAKTMMNDGLQAFKGLTRELFSPARAEIDALPNGHGGIVDCDGEKVGVYKDESGKAFTVSTRCPHLGCQLEWNPDELSWDCPCHGSRFHYNGTLLNGPAQENLPSSEE